jgi:type IV secretion system protein TrbL
VQFNSLTLTLQNFIAAFSGGYARLQGSANSLLGILVGIEVVLLGLWAALGGGDNVVGIFKKILHIGAWVWLVQSYPTLCKAFMESLVQAGLTAGGGGDVSLLMDPSRLAGYGLDATEPLTQKLADLGVTDLPDLIIFGFAYLAIMACFLIMAIHVFLAVLEYYLFAALVGIFLPFGLLAPTKFLAEKAVGAVVSSSVKLMVLAFVLSVVDPVLSQIHFQGPEIKLNELWSVFLTVCTLMLLTWKAPSLASALLGGSPHLGAGDVLQAASAPIAAGMAAGAIAARAGAGAASTGGAAAAGAAGGAGAPRAPSPSPAPAGGSAGASAIPAPTGGSGSSTGAAGDKGSSGPGGKDSAGSAGASAGTRAPVGASASLVQSAMGKAQGAGASPSASGRSAASSRDRSANSSAPAASSGATTATASTTVSAGGGGSAGSSPPSASTTRPTAAPSSSASTASAPPRGASPNPTTASARAT